MALGRTGWPIFAPDSRVLAVPHEGIVSLYDLATSKEIEQLLQLGSDVWRVFYSPDGTLLLSAGTSGKVRVWSCGERRLLRELGEPNVPMFLGGFGEGAKQLLTVDTKGKGIWWDTRTWQEVRSFGVELKSVQTGKLSPDGCLLGIGTQTGVVRWLNAETGELLAATSAGHQHHVVGNIAFSADGTQAASVAEDGTLALWDPSSLQLIVSFKSHMQGAHAVAFSPEGRRLATGGSGREAVKLWDLATCPCRELITLSLSGQGSMFSYVAFSPDGRWLIARDWEGGLHLWHAPSWDQIEAAEERSKSANYVVKP
jgi:WD40 repeat protein